MNWRKLLLYCCIVSLSIIWQTFVNILVIVFSLLFCIADNFAYFFHNYSILSNILSERCSFKWKFDHVPQVSASWEYNRMILKMYFFLCMAVANAYSCVFYTIWLTENVTLGFLHDGNIFLKIWEMALATTHFLLEIVHSRTCDL